jgi:hypothetical protein
MRIPPLAVLFLFSAGPAVSAQQPKPEPATETEAQPLLPAKPLVEFEHEAGLPPVIKGRKVTATQLEFKAAPDVLTTEAVASLREAALKDPRVKTALGARFFFLHAGPHDESKEAPVKAGAAPVRLRFYSYSADRAVQVDMAEGKVLRVVPMRKGYQPPESPQEVQAAAEILRRDKRYTSALEGLFVRGILTPSPRRHRELYLLFFKGEGLTRGPVLFDAVVDLSAGRVVSARPRSRKEQ